LTNRLQSEIIKPSKQINTNHGEVEMMNLEEALKVATNPQCQQYEILEEAAMAVRNSLISYPDNRKLLDARFNLESEMQTQD